MAKPEIRRSIVAIEIVGPDPCRGRYAHDEHLRPTGNRERAAARDIAARASGEPSSVRIMRSYIVVCLLEGAERRGIATGR